MRTVFAVAFQLFLSTIIIFELALTATCVRTAVNVTYSEYVGEELGNGVSQWLGLRYAAPPVGALRFVPPQDPLSNSEPQAANKVRAPWQDGVKARESFGGHIVTS